MNPIFDLTAKEVDRQKNSLHLIASDNYPSPKTLSLLGSLWGDKYAEGAPGKRYYAGQVYTDELELFVQEKALQAFDPTGEYAVNVQTLSGSPANVMVYLAMLKAGDRILSLSLANGGHLSHLHATSNYKKFFEHDTYDVKETAKNTFDIDLDDYAAKLKDFKPKLVIIGFSAYPRAYEFEAMCKQAHEVGALVLADISHINGLVAAGLHDSPFKKGDAGADFVMMTSHKTMRGPRGALLFAKKEYIGAINKTIFPGTSGGPHVHQIASTGQALLELLGEDDYPDKVDFKTYSQSVIDTCKVLEKALGDNGLTVISPTQNHLCLVRLPDEIDSLEAQRKLESYNIVTNRNMIPFDEKPAWRPSGMRLGTAALTSRGLTTDQASDIGKLIADIILRDATDAEKRVTKLVSQLNWYY